MFRKTLLALPLIVLLSLGVSRPAAAQWAVIDVGAIVQLVQQVATMEEQLSTAKDHLQQAQAEYQSITGGRGMENLLSGTARNYLPSDLAQLAGTLSGARGSFGALTASIQGAIATNAVLSPAQLAALSPQEQSAIQAQRQSVALLQAVSRQALSTTSARFASLQQLIDAIGGASDQKAVLDLQARISAEQGMLQNESTKLQVLYEAAQAEQWAQEQRRQEQAIADIGSLRALPAMGLR
jgi:type IV secretion system protein VirB5